MTASGRGISVSLLVHGAILSVIAVLSVSKTPERGMISIDLGILQPVGHTAAVAPRVRKTAQKRPAVQPETASPDAAPSPDHEQVPAAESPQNKLAPPDQRQGSGSSGTDEGPVDAERLRASYLDEYFVYIRDRIVKNLVFPPIARTKGWSGTANVSFLIRKNGSVDKIRILRTTGHAVLDRNVEETIRRVAPFPRPPVEAEVTIPIVFQLI